MAIFFGNLIKKAHAASGRGFEEDQCKAGDVIQVREKSKKLEAIHESMKRIRGDHDLPWLILDKAKMQGIFIQVPERDQMGIDVNEQLVVELYSK